MGATHAGSPAGGVGAVSIGETADVGGLELGGLQRMCGATWVNHARRDILPTGSATKEKLGLSLFRRETRLISWSENRAEELDSDGLKTTRRRVAWPIDVAGGYVLPLCGLRSEWFQA